MTIFTKKTAICGAVLLAGAIAGTSAWSDGSGHTPKADNVTNKILREQDKQFNPMFGPVEFADAFGDRAKGPHGTFGKFPAGFETPAHIHSHGYRAVVLKGTMTNPFEGEKNPPKMEPGSYWSVAAGAKHTTACVSETPCEFLMWGDNDFDFVPNG